MKKKLQKQTEESERLIEALNSAQWLLNQSQENPGHLSLSGKHGETTATISYKWTATTSTNCSVLPKCCLITVLADDIRNFFTQNIKHIRTELNATAAGSNPHLEPPSINGLSSL